MKIKLFGQKNSNEVVSWLNTHDSVQPCESWLIALSHGSHFVAIYPLWVASRNDRTFFSHSLRSLLPLPLAGPSSFPRNHTTKRQVHHSWCRHEKKEFQSVMPEVRDNDQRASRGGVTQWDLSMGVLEDHVFSSHQRTLSASCLTCDTAQ